MHKHFNRCSLYFYISFIKYNQNSDDENLIREH